MPTLTLQMSHCLNLLLDGLGTPETRSGTPKTRSGTHEPRSGTRETH